MATLRANLHAAECTSGEARVRLDGSLAGSLWWATKNERLGLLDVAGRRLEALYGGFAGEPLDTSAWESRANVRF
jgi:hypothetical protein